MDPRVSYALVGLFVLIFGGAFVALVFWLVGVEPAADYRTYAIYPPESVAGIGGETPVKYQGVDVGKVRQVGLDPRDPRRVRLLVDVRREVPIKVDTTASLASQGLTGLVYFIELRGGETGSAALEAAPGADYPVIRAELSDLTQLQRTGTELLEQGKAAAAELKETLVAVRDLIGGGERLAMGTLIEDAGRTAARLSQAAGTLNALVLHRRLAPDARHGLRRVDGIGAVVRRRFYPHQPKDQRHEGPAKDQDEQPDQGIAYPRFHAELLAARALGP